MNAEAWRLTDDEVDKYMKKGFGVAMEAQRAKRQAFEDGGGVILNPQALEVLYEALKKAEEDINWMLNNEKFLNPNVFDYIDTALAKAKEE